jgi:hypothetical protein
MLKMSKAETLKILLKMLSGWTRLQYRRSCIVAFTVTRKACNQGTNPVLGTLSKYMFGRESAGEGQLEYVYSTV